MFDFRNLTKVTKALLIINIVVFIITNLFNTAFFYEQFSAFYPASPFFKGWQIVTHMFMHAGWTNGGWMHILFNMIGLVSFGPALERVLGEKKFFFFYFACGLGAFVLYNVVSFYQVQQLLQMNTALAERSLAIIYGTPMVGASGAIFGVVTAFAILYPDAKLIIMPIPIPIKAKYILTVVIIGSIFMGIKQMDVLNNEDNVAHFAHLGGALVGFVWIMLWKKNRFRIN